MAGRRNRYNQLQQMISLALLAMLVLFFFYWIAAANEIVWLKAVLSVLIFLIGAACLGFLFITQELLRPRSLWMGLAAAAIALCLLLSLILHFPCPAPKSIPTLTGEEIGAVMIQDSV